MHHIPSIASSGGRLLPAYVEPGSVADRHWLQRLRAFAVVPLQYHPSGRYLCAGTLAALRAIEATGLTRRVMPLSPPLKSNVSFAGSSRRAVWLIVLAGDDTRSLCGELNRICRINPHPRLPAVGYFVRLRATATAEEQARLLAHPRVLAIEPYVPPVVHDEIAGLIVAGQINAQGLPQGLYRQWLGARGLSGAGVTIGIVDSGVAVDHAAFVGRICDLAPGKKSWHGTAMAGLAAGGFVAEGDEHGFLYGLGIAPGAHLLAQDRFAPPEVVCRQTVTESGPNGVYGTVQNNSFGKGTCNPMNYGAEEAIYDRLVRHADPGSPIPRPLTICFAAGNQGSQGLSRPAAAKNVLVTGNVSNYRPRDGGIEADDSNRVYPGDYDTGFYASSHGNCGDGRIRPHVVAPGQWTATANYGAWPGDRRYLSPLLTWAGGTSAASAITAGACALLIEWWRRHTGRDPSPAMLRTLLVNGAVDTGCGGPIPNPL